MLINIFGAWLIAANINFLTPFDNGRDKGHDWGCYIVFSKESTLEMRKRKCSEIAEEINKKVGK